MGGCRCAYRNCKATTDGRTHFFHFPVWDKMRCQEWITNAQRPEFLDLTISQLKNRVICENHFTDNMFMNEKKKSLVHNAVPTDGVDKFVTINDIQEKSPIDLPKSKSIDFLESLGLDESKFFTSRERQATLSVPYNQFLTKCSFETLNDPSLKKSLASPKKKTPFGMPIIFTESVSENEHRTKPLPPMRSQESIKKENSDEISNVVILSQKKINAPLAPPQPIQLKKVSPSFVLQKPKQKTSIEENEYPQVEELRVRDPLCLDTAKPNTVQSQIKNPPRIVSVHTLQSNDKITDNFYNLPVEFVPPLGSSVESLPNGGVTFVTPDNVPIITTVQNGVTTIKDPNMVQESQENRPIAPVHSKHHRLSIYKQKHSCRSPRKVRSLSAALLAKVNDNSKDIAEIKLMLQQRFKKKAKYHDDDDLRKEYLFDEISQYISTKLKNELFQELFANTKDNASGKRP